MAGSFIPRVAVLSSSYHGSATVFQFVYLWSKQNSNALVGVAGRAQTAVTVCGSALCWAPGDDHSVHASVWQLASQPRLGCRTRRCLPCPTLVARPSPAPRHTQISLYGFININGRHLPVAFLALDLLMGGDIWSDIMGIFMGHM